MDPPKVPPRRVLLRPDRRPDRRRPKKFRMTLLLLRRVPSQVNSSERVNGPEPPKEPRPGWCLPYSSSPKEFPCVWTGSARSGGPLPLVNIGITQEDLGAAEEKQINSSRAHQGQPRQHIPQHRQH